MSKGIESESTGASAETTTTTSSTHKIPFNTTKYDIKEKYIRRKDKSLFLRFPQKLPTDMNILQNLIKTLCNRVINIRRMRQKSTRCCLIDFNTKDDREKSLKELRKIEINNHRLIVKYPKTDNEKFLNKITELSERKRELKRMKLKLKKESSKAIKKLKTSSIIIHNVPQNSTIAKLQELFPNSIEIIRMPPSNNSKYKGIEVNIKFPTIEDAQKAKQKNIELNGSKLKISYDLRKIIKHQNKNKLQKLTNIETSDQT